MCGIAAIYAYDPSGPPVREEELLAVREAMFRRGPDHGETWLGADGRVGLAHRRLAIIDLAPSGNQPMEDGEGRLRVTFNGEIYNYRELRRHLEARGYRFRSQSDTEVLLHLYAEYGPRMVERLRGMYAFGIWDQARRELFLARDPFGIKPLYYADDGKCFRAASQVKALLAGGAVDTAGEPAGHVGFFLWGHVPEPFTLYRGIRALPAGSTLTIGPRGRRQATPPFDAGGVLAEAPPDDAPGEREERIREAMRDTVRHHMIADVPVGVFLSSGLDSTTLACLAAEASQPRRLETITLGFENFRGTPKDESPLAEAVAADCGANHQTVWVRKADFDSQLARLLESMDQPTIDGVNMYFVSKAAADSGLKVALSGLGGDEVFGGYSGFREIPRLVRATAPFAWMPAGKPFRILTAAAMRRWISPKYAGIFEYGNSFPGAYLLRRSLFMPWELPALLDPEMVREGWGALQTMARLKHTIEGAKNDFGRVCALEIAWYMRNQLLRDSDWAGMAHSLEIRVPLVDIELFRRLAPLANSPRPASKREMARTTPRPLPEAVLHRRKTGFGIPVHAWLESSGKSDGTLKGWARRVYAEFTAARPGGRAQSIAAPVC